MRTNKQSPVQQLTVKTKKQNEFKQAGGVFMNRPSLKSQIQSQKERRSNQEEIKSLYCYEPGTTPEVIREQKSEAIIPKMNKASRNLSDISLLPKKDSGIEYKQTRIKNDLRSQFEKLGNEELVETERSRIGRKQPEATDENSNRNLINRVRSYGEQAGNMLNGQGSGGKRNVYEVKNQGNLLLLISRSEKPYKFQQLPGQP